MVLEIINEFASNISFKYNKFYIGLAANGQPNNFAAFRPRKNALAIDIRLPYSQEIQDKIEESKLDDKGGYMKQWGIFRLRMSKDDITQNKDLLREILMKSYENSKL